MSSSGLAVALVLTAAGAWAQSGPMLREVTHARGFAMGGAHRALGLGGESVTSNPATMALYKRYLVEVSGAYDPATKFGFGGATVMDSATASLTGGVTYQFLTMGGDAQRSTAHFSTLAVAFAVSDRLMVGVSGRYLNLRGATQANGITMDAGLVIRATDTFTVGLSGHNLVDIKTPALSRSAALSFAYVGGLFALAADVRTDFLPGVTGPVFTYSLGGEYLAGDAFPLRAGYSYDNVTSSQFVSFGSGFVSAGSGLDVSYRHEVGGSQSRVIVGTIKIQLE